MKKKPVEMFESIEYKKLEKHFETKDLWKELQLVVRAIGVEVSNSIKR